MKRRTGKSVAIAMCAAILGLTAGCGRQDQQADGDGSDSKEESSAGQESDAEESGSQSAGDGEVEITLWANCYAPAELGVQHDPITDRIAEITGVRINCADFESNSNQKERLATMIASNDLPDVFYVPDEDSLNTLIEAGQILDLSEYWNEENCPNLCGGNPDASRRQDFLAETKLGGKRYIVQMWGGTGAEDQPTVGFYVPWDIYSQAGYPEVNSLGDLVDALETMHGIYSENPAGQPSYGAGAWFADEGSWGSWCVEQIALAMGYVVDPGYVYAFDMSTNDLMDKPPVTDPDSIWWQSVKFYYDLNQRGLLDPDSITQKSDQWSEKANSARYLMVMAGWEPAGLKEKTGLSYVALKPFADNIVLDWSGELSGNMYAVSSTCKNPEKALQLMDYLWTPEGSRLAFSGIEGESWEMVDGKAQYTQQRIEDEAALSKTELAEKYGGGLGHFTGYALNVISPSDGSVFELTYTPEYREKLMTEAEKDAFAYYGVSSLREIYTTGTQNVMRVLDEYTAQMSPLPDDLQKNVTDLQSFVYRNYLSCVYAKDDADFEAQKQAVIEGAADYNIDGLFQWTKEEFSRAKAIVDPYLE